LPPGNSRPVWLTNFIGEIERALGKVAIRERLPMQPGDVPDTFADVSALTMATGFTPRTSVAEGVAKLVEWYRAYYGRSVGPPVLLAHSGHWL
jgi:UDP-glucuronate 4-epimerase